MKALTVAQMRAVEAAAVEQGVSYLQLMENAGAQCARKISEKYYLINKNVIILCGSGNNGGDGFVIAKTLYRRGANVSVVLCCGLPYTQESDATLTELKKSEVEILNSEDNYPSIILKLKQSDFIVDCMFGTGFHGALSGGERQLIERANSATATRIAIDIPSGVCADNGDCLGTCFYASYTLVLGAYKRVHELPEGKKYCGEIELLDIGIPPEAFEGMDLACLDITLSHVKKILKPRDPHSNKGDYGKLLILAGSIGMGGAALMCTKAALRTGCGITILATPKTIANAVFPQIMEAMTLPLSETFEGSVSDKDLGLLLTKLDMMTACVIGCGLGDSVQARQLVKAIIKSVEIPIILDADGINAVAADIDILRAAKCPMILTPHPGEMARLLNITVEEVLAKKEKLSHDFAVKHRVVLLLKGHETLIATPSGGLFKNTTGNAGMAKGGSGDVLSGMLGAFAAQGISLSDAAVLGAYMHGLAGDYAATQYSEYAMTAGDIIENFPMAFNTILKEEDV